MNKSPRLVALETLYSIFYDGSYSNIALDKALSYIKENKEMCIRDRETVRLRSHISQLRDFISSDEAVGRKLDFLIQEINRETNTIGSKMCIRDRSIIKS